MKASEFLETRELTAVETVDNIIINLIIEESVYGLDVDTSSIEAGTPLTRTSDFVIEGDILSASEASLDLSTTDILGTNTNFLGSGVYETPESIEDLKN